MIYSVEFSKEALETFDAIKEQVNARFGAKQMQVFEDRTVKVVQLIQTSPLIFPAVATNINVRKGFIHRNCAMFYEIKSTRIEILYFWDNRQEPGLL